MSWQRTYCSSWIRQQEIGWGAAQLLWGIWWDRWNASDPTRCRQRRARWLVNCLVQLGPTFIQLGQALSTRIDLLPVEYIQALKTLPGWMPPMRAEIVIACIEAELGASAYLLYRTFDPTPIAADSLGQMHRATLPNGEAVVVQIQRPELEQLFQVDLTILRKLVRLLQRYVVGSLPCNIERLLEEFAHCLDQKLNWIQTGLNADRLRYNFQAIPGVWIPKIYPAYTTKRLLTMEYAPGVAITDRPRLVANGTNLRTIQERSFSCYLKQILQDGFFQAYLDLNRLAVSQDGRLILYGFSDLVALSPLQRTQLAQALLELQRHDLDAVLHTLVNGGWLEPDMPPFLIKQILQTILKYLDQVPLQQQAFNQMAAEIYLLFRRHPFCLPSHTLWILQGLASLDRIAQSLNPTCSFLEVAQTILNYPPIYLRPILRTANLRHLFARQRS